MRFRRPRNTYLNPDSANQGAQCQNNNNCRPCVLTKYAWLVLLLYALFQWLSPQLGWSQGASGTHYHGQPLQAGVSQIDRFKDRGIVGVDLTIRPGNYPIVRGVFPLSPADKAGLRIGDVVLAIDGGNTLNQDRHTVDDAISDIPGDRIQFLINRPGEQPRVVMVTVMSLLDAPPSLKQLYSQP